MVVQPKPGPELLKKCDKPMLPDPSKSIEQNGEAFADLAQKFRECEARQGKLVDWFKD